jgi:hypothetical protein
MNWLTPELMIGAMFATVVTFVVAAITIHHWRLKSGIRAMAEHGGWTLRTDRPEWRWVLERAHPQALLGFPRQLWPGGFEAQSANPPNRRTRRRPQPRAVWEGSIPTGSAALFSMARLPDFALQMLGSLVPILRTWVHPRVAEMFERCQPMKTGDAAFDEAFMLYATSPRLIAAFTPDVRGQLLTFIRQHRSRPFVVIADNHVRVIIERSRTTRAALEAMDALGCAVRNNLDL